MSDEAFSRQQKYQLVQEDYYGTVEYYDERYDTTVEFGAAFSDFITVLPPNAVVLDIGSGPGKEASVIADRAQKVVALDLSAGMLAKVKARNPAIET
ncbi:MAG TPA: class I SAM-dependent methyltransferase, partial [Ktedonosporobacter sp.]|nr:class I SAM-dependent methyltransferase [Ktedonosporobacter sp.]